MLLAPLARMMVQEAYSGGSEKRHPKKKRRRSRSRSRHRRRSPTRSRSRSQRSHRSASGKGRRERSLSPPPPPPPRRRTKTPSAAAGGPPVLQKEVPTSSQLGENPQHNIIIPSIHSSELSASISPVLPATTVRTGTHEDLVPARVADSLTYVNVAHSSKDGASLDKVEPVAKEHVLFVENRSVQKLTASERIALAYKYDESIQPPVVVHKERNSGFRGSDEDEKNKEKEVKIKNPTTFPPSPDVTDSWFEYSKKHHKNTKPVVFYEFAQTTGEENQPVETTPAAAGAAAAAEVKGVVKKGTGVYKKVVKNNALKDPPEKLKWTFDHHDPGWADMVEKDQDIALIVLDPKKDHQMELRLCKKEWQNLQLAQNFILNAASHIQYYLHSSREAINQVLDTLDPAIESSNLEKLQDTKAMLKGVGYGMETLTSMAVYSHAGITALQREQFLTQECGFIPEEVKGVLIGQPFGSHWLYNGKLAAVHPQIVQARKEHQEKLMQQALLNQLNKDGKDQQRGGGSRDDNRSSFDHSQDGFVFDSAGRGGRGGARGGRGGRGRGRGRPPKRQNNNNKGPGKPKNAGQGRDHLRRGNQGDGNFKPGNRRN